MSDERTILVVDDDLFFSSNLSGTMRRLGLLPVVADAPAQVLARAGSLEPRAILVNLASRSLGSLDRVRELKSEPNLAAIPVLGYCGHLEVDLVRAGREAGCDLVVANSAIASDLATLLRRVGVTLPESD